MCVILYSDYFCVISERVSSVTVHAPLKLSIIIYCGAGLCKFSVFYTCDCFTDPITEVKVKVQEKHVNAHDQCSEIELDLKQGFIQLELYRERARTKCS